MNRLLPEMRFACRGGSGDLVMRAKMSGFDFDRSERYGDDRIEYRMACAILAEIHAALEVGGAKLLGDVGQECVENRLMACRSAECSPAVSPCFMLGRQQAFRAHIAALIAFICWSLRSL